ncbi:MAG: sigma-70 family RNA polymerase sigma factor, partial [Thermoleophilaceae bacterium]|nr:sigma-70 family RNA polymerase sigma factor [Thermoleophilaceae bacterium]
MAIAAGERGVLPFGIDVDGFVERHGGQLIATARRYSGNSVDAEDAYQRALEKLLTKAPSVDSEEELIAWMCVVTRNEALMIQRSNQ